MTETTGRTLWPGKGKQCETKRKRHWHNQLNLKHWTEVGPILT